jgi:integrase
MAQMVTPLHIPPSKKWKGLTVYCYKCQTNVSDICKETGNPLARCPFGEKHAFKVYVHVPGKGNERRTKKLNTRDVNEAIRQAIDFEKEVKTGNQRANIVIQSPKETQREDRAVPHLLVNAIARYVGSLHNEDVPEHMKKERSKEYVDDIERKLKLLVLSLKQKGYDLSSLMVDQINDTTVGHVYAYLKNEKNFSARTFNKHFSYYTSFLKWFSEEYYPVRAWFTRVDKMKPISNPQAIAKDEFEALLKQITPENGFEKYTTGVKKVRNFYRPYLKNAFRLALETGRRREELINMKFSGITEEKDGSGYIKVEDFKVNNIQKRKREEEKKYIYVPLTNSLRQLLDEMGYQEMKGSDNFILAPEVKGKRGHPMEDLLSRAFTHYYKQLNTGRELTFKSFRKTYITNLSVYMGSNARAITGHTNERTIDEHYKDKQVIAKAARNFEVFSKEVERKNDLQEIRNESLTSQKSLEVEQ